MHFSSAWIYLNSILDTEEICQELESRYGLYNQFNTLTFIWLKKKKNQHDLKIDLIYLTLLFFYAFVHLYLSIRTGFVFVFWNGLIVGLINLSLCTSVFERKKKGLFVDYIASVHSKTEVHEHKSLRPQLTSFKNKYKSCDDWKETS